MINNFKKYSCLFYFLVICILLSCNENKSTENDLANVFKPLDGIWEGDFIVYIDTLGQQAGIPQPKEIDYAIIDNLSFKLQAIVKTKHIYKSVTPFYQEGEIKDIITNSDGTEDTIKSNARNLVKNNKLKCFVYKPTEIVVHDGKYFGNNTIVWQRSLKKPFKIEYFKETVKDGHYKIIGWGYYGKDNPNLTPRTWFYADYRRIYDE